MKKNNVFLNFTVQGNFFSSHILKSLFQDVKELIKSIFITICLPGDDTCSDISGLQWNQKEFLWAGFGKWFFSFLKNQIEMCDQTLPLVAEWLPFVGAKMTDLLGRKLGIWLCILNLSGDGRGGRIWAESRSALDLSHIAPFEFRRNYLRINIRVDVHEWVRMQSPDVGFP